MSKPIPLAERIWERIIVDSGNACYPWAGAKTSNGYGITKVTSKRTTTVVHRVVYELMVGPIPEGWVVDHLCHNRACVNPDHLEAVTTGENCRRAREYGREMAA